MSKEAWGYQLRHAAGYYWLLDMRQAGIPYRPPLPINEIGADIWRLIAEQGMSREDAAKALSGEYGVAPSVLKNDIDAFLAQLAKSGIQSR